MTVSYDPRERFHDRNEEMNMGLDGLQGRIWTALPGIIKAVHWNNGAPYAEVQPAVMGRVTAPDHSVSFKPLPVLPHCPLAFPRGGGFSLTFPVAPGDECLLIFSSRALDEWWQTGKAAPAYDLRMHDLSDAIAYVGLTSESKPIASKNISQTSAQLRSDDGKVSIDISETGLTQTVGDTTEKVTADSITWTVGDHTMTMSGSGLSSNKDATFTGTVTGETDVLAGGISGKGHAHTGVQKGSDSTGGPV